MVKRDITKIALLQFHYKYLIFKRKEIRKKIKKFNEDYLRVRYYKKLSRCYDLVIQDISMELVHEKYGWN